MKGLSFQSFVGVIKAVLAAAFITLLISCFSLNNSKGSSNSAVVFYYKIELMSPDGGLVSNQDSMQISYTDSFAVYRINISHEYRRVIASGTTGDSAALISSSTDHKYFVAKRGSTHGFEFDSASSDRPKKKTVQAVLGRKIPFNPAMFLTANDSFVSAEKLSGTRFIEKYIPKTRFDETYPDTTIYEFDRSLLTEPFALSKSVDSLKQAKLFKVTFQFNPVKTSDGKLKSGSSGREIVFGFRKTEVTDQKVTNNLIEKVRQL